MHVGRIYPYHFELWPVTALFWPGYVPRKVHVSFPPVMPPGTSFWSGFGGCSAVGVVAADRESVDYLLPDPPDGVDVAFVRLETEIVEGVKYYVGRAFAVLSDATVVGIGNHAEAPATSCLLSPLFWNLLDGIPIPPVNCGGAIRGCTWAESDPPTSNRHLGQWIKEGP